MGLPFRTHLDELFRGDRSLWLKIGGCALVGAFVVVAAMLKGGRRGGAWADLDQSTLILAALVGAGGGAFVGLLLSFKDGVERRLAEGAHVPRILRLYFASGGKSLALWFFTILLSPAAVLIALAVVEELIAAVAGGLS